MIRFQTASPLPAHHVIRRVSTMTFFSAALALLLHLLPSGVGVAPLRAQSSRKDDIVFNSRGIPLSGASVRVCSMPASGQPCSPLAQIYSDSALTQALANPTSTDGLGNYFFYAAPGKYMIEVSGPGITTKQLPNVILPNDPTAPTFSTVSSTGAISAFSLSLTGNLTVNGSTVILGNLASGTLNLTNQSTPPGASSAGTVNLYTKSADKKLYYKDETGTETGPVGTGGGGANPLGNNGDLQSKNGAALQASGLNDNGTTVVINRDQQNAGPNPYFDIRAYGATTSGASTTGSINSGSATLTLASAQDFANGQGIVIYGAGAATALTTPSTPSVTPNLSNGATTWNYKVIAEDYKGGLTAAGPTGTTTSGSATLGLLAVGGGITTISRTAGIYTITTASAHNLQAGVSVYVAGVADPSANGSVVVNSTPSSTTFTYVVGQNPPLQDYGSLSTSGTVQVNACNTIRMPASTFSGSGTLRYWLYRSQGAGAFSLAGVAIGLDPYFVDCGGAAPNPPSYVPSTPPSSAQAGYLVTTISSGGGSTSLTLANTAATSVSSAAVLHDSSLALLAAMNAAVSQVGGTVYVPSTAGGGFWAFNSSTDMTSVSGSNSNYITILINGNVGLAQPWILRSNLNIQGMTKRGSSFMYVGGANFGSSSGYPLLYAKTQNSINLRNLFLNCGGTQCSDFFSDTNGFAGGSVGIIVENTDFANNSNSGGTSRNVVIKGGFDYIFRQWTCDPASGSTVLPAPCLDITDSTTATENPSQMAGRMLFSDGYVSAAGLRITDVPNTNSPQAAGYHFRSVLDESYQMPLLRVQTAEITSDISMQDVISADAVAGPATPVIDASGTSHLNGVILQGGYLGSNGTPLFIGPSGASVVGLNAAGNSQNINYGNAAAVLLGEPGGQAQTLLVNQPLNLANGSVHYLMAIPAAPSSCTVSSGGNVPVGNHTYTLTAVDFDGNETIPSLGATVTTTTGNQTVTCNLPSVPTGAKGFTPYRDAFRAQASGCTNPELPAGTASFTDTLSFTCGNSAPAINNAGSSSLSSSGLSTYQLRLNGAPLTGTTGAATVAATGRGSYNQGHLPTFDANGNLVDSGVSPTNVTDFFNRASGNLGSETNSPWTVTSGTLLVSAGGVGGNTSGQNYAAFTGVGFPNDDQSVSAVWVKTGTPTVQSNVLTLRNSTTALTNYNCGPNNTGTSVSINKFVSGTFTSLASQATTVNNGDLISFNVSGTSLNCYVNGAPIVAASDSSISSGFPGLGAFQSYNANGANLQWKNWMASPGYVSLQRPQTWSQIQTFTPGIVLGSDQVSNGPRALFNTFLPGALTSTWTGSTITLDKPITVTRVQVQAKAAPSGCSTNAIVRLTDGTTPISVTISAAANDSGAISQSYSAGASLTVSVQTAASGCTTSPADANALIQYKMQ